MRQGLVFLVVSVVVLGLYACGAGTPASTSADSDTCPVVDPGPPPVCPEGCVWNGKECRQGSGIVMDDARPKDGGTK